MPREAEFLVLAIVYAVIVILGLLFAYASNAQQPIPLEGQCDTSNGTEMDISVSMEQRNDNWGFEWVITNNSTTSSIASWEWRITGGAVFDIITSSGVIVPDVGANNDDQESAVVAFAPVLLVGPGQNSIVRGDIDGTVGGFSIILTTEDGTSTPSLPLVQSGNLWDASIQQAPEVGDPTSCVVYNQSIIYFLTGQERTLRWGEHQDDADRMDLYYRIEYHEFPPGGESVPVATAEMPEGTNEHPWTPDRAGLYHVLGQACRTDVPQDGSPHIDPGQDPDDPADDIQTPTSIRPGTIDEYVICSDWAESLDPEDTDSEVFPRGFLYVVQLAPATGGVIE